jgi:hypothetical protein
LVRQSKKIILEKSFLESGKCIGWTVAWNFLVEKRIGFLRIEKRKSKLLRANING